MLVEMRAVKLEAGDPIVPLELLTPALLALGASRTDVTQAHARRVA